VLDTSDRRAHRNVHRARSTAPSDKRRARLRRLSTGWPSHRSTSRCGVPCSAIRVSSPRRPGFGSGPHRLTEVFNLPADDPRDRSRLLAGGNGSRPHGVLWAPLATDTRPLRPPRCTGRSTARTRSERVPRGLELIRSRPAIQGRHRQRSAEAAYYDWVDQYDAVRTRLRRAVRHRQRKATRSTRSSTANGS